MTRPGPSEVGAAELSADDAATAPLRRAVRALWLVTLRYAVGQQLASARHYQHQQLSWVLIAVMAVWPGASAFMLSRWHFVSRASDAADHAVGRQCRCLRGDSARPVVRGVSGGSDRVSWGRAGGTRGLP
ncbi:hypothetical protein ACW2Q0_01865 [Nocardia sp. R16R-3T]